MNFTHPLMVGLAAAALLGLSAGDGSLFLTMAPAAQISPPRFAGYADLPGVRL